MFMFEASLNSCNCFTSILEKTTLKTHTNSLLCTNTITINNKQPKFVTSTNYSSNKNKNNNNTRIINPIHSSSSSSSLWVSNDDDDEGSYEVLPNGKRVYLDEQDIVTFLDPPIDLIPLDPSSYNPAAYLWKKIEDVPEERRHRLLHLLEPRLMSKAWEIAGTRYEVPNLSKKAASALLSDGDTCTPLLLEFWNCRTSGVPGTNSRVEIRPSYISSLSCLTFAHDGVGPMPLSMTNFFQKAIFRCKNGTTCGRLLFGPLVAKVANSFRPLYFTVSQDKEVMSTEHPCDFSYRFGDGISDIHEYPSGFPEPAKHPWPFNDQVVIYVRHLGPGVLVGQAWQEGEDLKKVPQKLCGEIFMVEDYAPSGDCQ